MPGSSRIDELDAVALESLADEEAAAVVFCSTEEEEADAEAVSFALLEDSDAELEADALELRASDAKLRCRLSVSGKQGLSVHVQYALHVHDNGRATDS